MRLFIRAFVLLSFVLSAMQSFAQVSGTAFKDFNFNGTRQISGFPTEPGVYGVLVKAYNAAGIQLGTTKTTTVAGAYSFSSAEIPSGTAVRIEFTALSGTVTSKSGADNGSNVQFVTAPSTTINYGIASEDWYSSTANPYVATTAVTNGNPNGGGTAGTNNNIYVFPWDMGNGTPDDGGATRRVPNSQLGSTFGLAFQHSSRTLLVAAYLKRHAGFGPNGIGAIYKTQVSATGVPAAATLLVDVSAIGINVGTDPRTVALPAASNTRSSDVGVFSQIGKRGIGGIDLTGDGQDLYIVNMFEKKLQRINIGNPMKASFSASDVTGSWLITDPGIAGTVWHPMACKIANGKVYVGGVTAKEQTTAFNLASDTAGLRGIVYEFNPANGTFTEVLRFPLSRRRGFSNNDYRYPTKNNWWCSWQNNGNGTATDPLRVDYNTAGAGAFTGGIYYPQPMLSDIEFDVDGSMILGIRDRFGDQTGYQNLMDDGEPTTPFATNNYFRALTSGELLRAGKNISANSFTIENLASTTTNGVTTSSAGLAVNNLVIGGTDSWTGGAGNPMGNYYGPGWAGVASYVPAGGPNPGTQGGYFYFNHNFETNNTPGTLNSSGSGAITAHYEKSNGGIALLAGSNEVIHSLMDPVATSYAQGVSKCLNSGAQAGNMSQRLQLFATTTGAPGDPTNMGKANAIGDIELLTDAMPIEIGNRIWNDANANGIQDAGETTAGVTTGTTVNLYTSTGVLVATTTTDAAGNYYFSTLNVANDPRKPASWIGFSSNAILPGFDYQIRVAVPANNQVTATNISGPSGDNIDNDATLSGANAIVDFNTSAASHDYDIGFTTKAIIGNRVWLDNGSGGGTAANGIQDGAEPGVAGVTVMLYSSTNGTAGDGDDVLINTTVTDAYGNYQFSNLTAGTNYFIKVLPPANYSFSPQTNTANDQAGDATGSDVSSTTGSAYGTSYMVVLTTGENEQDIDAGLVFSQYVTQSIGDRIWLDNGAGGGTASDGIQNGNEPGMAGVVVSLYYDADNNGTITGTEASVAYRTAITDVNGNYNFTNLTAGNYQIGITLLPGFTYTTYNAGGGTLGTAGESNTDNDIQTSGAGKGLTPLFNLAAGVNLINVDGGFITTSSTTSNVGDFIWNDLNQNGVQDAGEPGLPGVTVTLYASDGTTVIATTITNAFGGYVFTNLTAGNYVIGIAPPSGYTVSPLGAGGNSRTDNDISPVTFKTGIIGLTAGIRNSSIDAGLYQTSPAGTAKIGDRVWFDNGIGSGTAGDGIQNGTEPGVGGVTVILYNNAGTVIGTTSTDANGNYIFTGLAAGTYSLGFSNLPPGYSFTPTWSTNLSNATNSDVNPATGRTATFTITAASSNLNADAGLIAGQPSGTGSFGNKVFIDLNNNGIQNAGETGASGVTVTLQYDANNDGAYTGAELSFATQTTNSLGEYLFTGLNAGNYRVVFSNGPAGYNIATSNAGTNDNLDSDGDNAGLAISSTTSTTGTYNLAQGEDNLSVDLGIVKSSGSTGSISDRVWFDVNNNGTRDANEPGLPGVTVTLYDAAGTILAVTTTDANGYYLFDNLAAKTTAIDYYQVGFSNYPTGLVPSSQTLVITNDYSAPNVSGKTQQVNLAAGQNRSDVDFGLSSVKASLGNFVWQDSNGNGVQDSGEPGISGVTVLLYFDADNNGTITGTESTTAVTSIITDQNGQYLLTNLAPGNYQASFTTVPGGLAFTQQNTPGDNGDDTNSDASPLTGRTGLVNLAVTEADLTIDAGLYKPIATIGDYVWADNNGNNVQDAADQGVAGVLVTLYTSAGVPVSSTVTDKSGQYLFTNVPPGNYYVGFTNTPNGSLFVTALQGGDGTKDSDVTGGNGSGTTATFSVPYSSVNITMDAGLVYTQILPVRIQFMAYKRNSSSELVWQISGDAGEAKKYVVERSADGSNYTAIGNQLADGRTSYQQMDIQPVIGINYYRIKIEYINGRTEYSEVRIVRFDKDGSITIFPNPVSNQVNIILPDSWQGKTVQMDVINSLGQTVIHKTQNQASQIETIDVSRLAKGIYDLKLTSSANEIQVRKLQVTQ